MTARVWSISGTATAPDGASGVFTGTLTEAGAPPPGPPTAEISVTPPSVEVGQVVTLVWEATGATSAAVTDANGVLILGDLSGSHTFTATLVGTHTYTLTATGPGGTATASATLTVTEPEEPPPGPSLPLRFDFGTPLSPVEAGWVGTLPEHAWSEELGFGWVGQAPQAQNRGIVPPSHFRWEGTPLNCDFCFARDMTFRCRVPAGTHPVKLVLGDLVGATLDADIYLQGVLVDTYSAQAGYTLDRYYQASCPDGLLDVRLVGRGSNVCLCAMEVGGEYVAPSQPQATHRLDFGTATSPLQDGYERVTERDYYNSQRCRGFESTWSLLFSRERNTGSPLLRDFVMNRDMTYRLDVPPGSYRVRPTMYDPSVMHDFRIYLQGVEREAGLVTLPAGTLLEPEYECDAPDGVIRLRVWGYKEGGGSDEYGLLNALVVEPADGPPPPPAPTARLEVRPSTVLPGETAQLDWWTTNAVSASLHNVTEGTAEAVGLNGGRPVTASRTTTWMLMATGLDGTTVVSPDVTLTVSSLPDPSPGPPPNITVSHGNGIPDDIIPDYGYNATHVAVRSGSWSDPSVWGAAGLPGPGAVVALDADVVRDLADDVPLAVVSPRAGRTLSLLSGSRLRCQTLLTLDGSMVQNLLFAPAPAELVLGGGTAFPEWDPKQYGQGLICLGQVDLRGPSRGRAWGWTGAGLTAGQTVIPIINGAADQWRAGDRLLIPDTRRNAPLGDHDEFAVVAEVGANSITLVAPLQRAHPGSGPFEYGVPVANLSRDVVVRSAETGLKAHTLFTGHAKAWLQNVEFRDLGRTTVDPLAPGTNQIGRYAGPHAHHLHTHDHLPPMHMEGCSVWVPGAPTKRRWGVTVHGTSDCVVRNNAVYNTAGWCYGTESGTEARNLFEDLWGGGSVGYGNSFASPDSRNWKDVGFSGEIFWFRNTANVLRRSVAVNSWVGIGIYATALPASLNVGGVVCDPRIIRLDGFTDNYCLGGRMQDGMTIWDVGTTGTLYPIDGAPEQFVRNVTSWNIGRSGYLNYDTHRLRLFNFRNYNAKLGFFAQHYLLSDFLMDGGHIEGCQTGVYCGNQTGNPATLQTYQGVHFKNNTLVDIRVRTKDVASSEAHRTPNHVILRGCTHEGSATRIWMDPTLEGLRIDLTAVITVDVYDFNGVPGDNFRVYFHEQHADYIMPPANEAQGGPIRYGNPVPGWTNGQLAAAGLPVYGGAVAPPDATTRPGIIGLVGPIP